MENLDEAVSGGRVTRSLRKRLTSVDSDASSRPGTPVQSKLSAISESPVPSLPLRMTRRNSITTPVKSVASKGKVGGRATTPEVSSPARRSGRKRSISVVDVDQSSPVVRDAIKQPIFDTLAEEEFAVTRSKSKSPQPLHQSPQLQVKLHRSIKLEPNVVEESEVEIINCESEEEDAEVQKKAKRKSRKLSIKEEVVEVVDDGTDASTETKKIATPKIKKEKIQNKSPGHIAKPKETENQTEDNKQLNDSLRKSEAPEDVIKPEEVTNVQGQGSAPDTKKKGFVITEVVTLENITPTTMEKLVNSGRKDTSVVSDKSPERSKSVAFNDSEADQGVRSVYPKTPGLTKTKSYIDVDSSRDKSFQSDKGSAESFKDAESNELPDSNKPNMSMDSADYHRVEAEAYDVDPLMPSYTPYKSKLLLNEQSSTPISCVTPTGDDDREAGEDLENELSCSPDKFLRSGKNYGNSPTFSPKSSPKVVNKSANEATRAEVMENSLKEAKQTSAESPIQMTVKSPPKSLKQTPLKSPKEASVETPKQMTVQSPKKTPAKSLKETPAKSPKETPAKSPKETLVKSPNKNVSKSPKNKNSQSGDEMVSSTVATPVEKSPTKVVDKELSFANSWSQGVSGKANGGQKIDEIMAIIDVDKPPKVIVEQKSPLQKTPTPRKRLSRYESEDEEIVCDDEHIDEEEEEAEELAADEVAHTKHAFMDDEAMEVDDDYASGDSMDEEERREIEENAIEEDGESIGSDDTEEDDHDHGDDEEENGSFIVSDSERDDELLEYSDENEHLEEEEKTNGKKTKNYRRIQVISSESESDVEIIEEKVNNKPEKNSVDEDTESISHDFALQVSKFIDEEISDSELMGALQTPPIESPNKRKSTSRLNASQSSVTLGGQLNESNTDRKSLNMSKSKLGSSEAHNILSKHESLVNDVDSNTSKLSESALKLQYESESEATEDERTTQQMNESRKEILNLNKSDRFNKTVHELDTEHQETTPETMEEEAPKRVSIAANKSTSELESKRKSLSRSNLERSMREAIATSSSEEDDNEQVSRKPLRKAPLSQSLQMQRDQAYESSSSDEEEEAAEKDSKASKHSLSNATEMKVLPRKSLNASQRQRHLAANSSDDESSPRKPSVSLLGEVSASSSSKDSDEPEEKATEPTLKKSSAGLSVSFDQPKKKNNKEIASGKIRHSFFTLDVNVNKYANATAPEPPQSSSSEQNESENDDAAAAANNSKAQSSSLNSTTDNAISNEEEQELQKLAEIQKLTHHLHTTSRRQSLAVPASYTAETSTAKKPKRKSFCPPSTEEVLHSQSFVDRINERKRELQLQNTKRKRLSKSFCGAAGGSLDTTDHEVRHLHKKSKLSQTDSESESEQALSEAIPSDSPPRIKSANDDNNNIQRILGRCDEILEAANRAKLEAKINYKKSHVKLPKKRKQSKKFKSESSENEENAIPLVSKKEMKRKEKTKLALKQALKASVGIILNVPGRKKQPPLLKINDESLEAKRLPPQILEAISVKEDAALKKKKKVPSSDIPQNPKPQQSKTFKTNAGAVVVAPLTPQKRKKSHITKFQHATGTVSVEPASPARKPNVNGFRESPLQHTTGFKVRQILTAGQDKVPTLPASSSLRRDGKRKRIVEPTHTLPKPQWSQSGLFLEEKLPTRAVIQSGSTEFHLSGLQGGSRKSKKATATFASTALNFKNSTLFRNDIPREHSHILLQRKERRYVHNQF